MWLDAASFCFMLNESDTTVRSETEATFKLKSFWKWNMSKIVQSGMIDHISQPKVQSSS